MIGFLFFDLPGAVGGEEGGKVVDLNATGTDVPQKVKDILRLGDVNFQFQLDSPYLLSLPASEASRYLNRIIHLDSIDKLLSEADSDKRRISAERKVVEKDIKECALELESLSWVAEAEAIQKRIDKYSQLPADLVFSAHIPLR